MMRSLKSRLFLGITLASILILGSLGVALHWAMERALLAEFDENLLSRAKAVAALIEQSEGKVIVEFEARDFPEFSRKSDPDYFDLQIDGKPFLKSPSLANAGLNYPANRSNDSVARDILLPDGRAGRALALDFVPRPEEGEQPQPMQATIVVARDTNRLRQNLAQMQWIITAICLGAIAASGAIAWLVVNRAMRPLNEIAAQIETMNEAALSSQLNTADIPTEIVPVVVKVNALFTRLDQAFARERAFTADAAHELRTPIAGLRATLEVCQSRPRDPAVYSKAIDKSLAMLTSMQSLVENLLLLARADAMQLHSSPADVNIVELINRAWEPFLPRVEPSNLQIRWELPDDCTVRCDPTHLQIILTNLFENAVSYTNTSGSIHIGLRVSTSSSTLEIANTGCQIPGDQAGNLFKRFWRHDAARSQTGLHSGLGLSLCERLIALNGGKIIVSTHFGGEFSISLTLPASTQHPGVIMQY